MRKPTLIAGLFALALGMAPVAAIAQADLVGGTVTKIDEPAGKITLRHGPIKKLGMDEGMTMVFRVQDPSMLKQFKVDDKVKFDADRVNGQLTVTRMQKAK